MDDDRLSELPDSLILTILSLLDMKDVVMTSLLSKRWKNRWTTVPCLRFDLPFSGGLWVEYSKFVSGALAQWKGAKILEFTIFFSSNDPLTPSCDTDSWLLFATEKQVEKLTFGFECRPHGAYFVPQCLYSCSSITTLSLYCCSFKIERNVRWNQLKSLNIRKSEGLSGDAMNQILLGAPRLEKLVLRSFEISENFTIRSTSLMILEIIECNLKAEAELRIWAPNLLSLEISAYVCGSCLLYVPSLITAILSFEIFCGELDPIDLDDMAPLEMFHQVFRSIRYVQNVSLSDWSIQFLVDMKENDMLVQFPNAEFLKLDFRLFEMFDVRVVLEMFPKLKRLIVDQGFKNDYMYNSVSSEMISRSPFLPHLKTVEVIYSSYLAISPLVKFLLENARVLQEMVLQPNGEENDREAFVSALKELLGTRRSSPYAKLIINEFMADYAYAPELIPLCRCGRGKMLVKCAGKEALHAGRFYYKCPANIKHQGSFLWCDEYHQNEVGAGQAPRYLSGRMYTPEQEAQSASLISQVRAAVLGHGDVRPMRLRSDIEIIITSIFMALAFLFGVVIGKFL
ncbi:FBD-associated F-box protein At5g22730-like isoform X2 [Salvia miltiorrhiza]|uniref:FBD-associated F-box protein At5g22730-like isoform X2 n=1 Tax=Salvia miltiorrhiza TaxID=226208 RepID=UPI0025AC5680|nr:FBD-associated F-box protein At5g22730-like isoform X2 [Salvia miltiorrhiza]